MVDPGMTADNNETKARFAFHIILFSFNRAMQCESVLRSIRLHVKSKNLTISVVWRATGSHQEGYALLRQLYEPDGVRFYEQAGRVGFLRHVLPCLWRPRNLYHWVKFDFIRQADNFKPLLEQIIRDSAADFVSFNTDDNIYYRDESLPEFAFRQVREDPYSASYRVRQGINLADCSSNVCRELEFLHWDYYDPTVQSSWAYPFSVDGQFYERSALLSVIHRVLYHNPVTLESYSLGYVRHQRLFRCGYSPIYSSMMAVSLNKVSFIVPQNTRGNLSIGKLNELFLAGYVLEYDLPEQFAARELIPKQVTAVRGNERLVIPVLTDPVPNHPVPSETKAE